VFLVQNAHAQVIDSSIIREMESVIENGTYPNIHSVLISYKNELVYEKYWAGNDEKWGDDLGMTIHSKERLHDVRSISKSIVSACIGIAIQQGKIKSVHEKVFDFFPEYAKYDTGMKSMLTIKHLLTMSSGFTWNEEVPYDDPENSETRMTRSANQAEYVLSQPMDYPPGKVWKYNGGTTQLLAAIIEKTTGMKVDEFASKYLFTPLGISRFEWTKYPGTGQPAAASGLRLVSRDLLKFGLLYNNRGIWNNKQIIKAEWVEESIQSQVEQLNEESYGYQFWLWQDTIMNKPTSIVACVGNGDQRIFIDKTNDLVIVITAGNYNKWKIKNNATALLKNYIYPAMIMKK
jgi:CubicO group peptidase (beta-lactamase class C family)